MSKLEQIGYSTGYRFIERYRRNPFVCDSCDT